MDIESTGSIKVLEKNESVQSNATSPVTGNIVQIKTWSQSSGLDKSVTGKYLLGGNQLNSEIQQTIKKMKVGDIFKISHINQISQKEQVFFLQLISHETQIVLQSLAPANKRAEEEKKLGNQLIKEKKYDQAINRYKKAYELIEYNCDQIGAETRLSVVSNLALATLSLGRFEQCLQWCQKHTGQSVEVNKKIWYREVSAYRGLKNWQKAKQQTERAIAYYKQDKEATSDFMNLKQAIEKQEKIEMAKQKNLYKNMFG